MVVRKISSQAGNAKKNNILQAPDRNVALQAACWVLLAGVFLHVLQTPSAGLRILAELILISYRAPISNFMVILHGCCS